MKTQNLDEAVFLNIKGFKHTKVRVIAERHSEWTFDDSQKVAQASKQFWTGSPVVSLNKWLLVRQAMKHEQKTLLAEKKPPRIRKDTVEMKHPAGMQYWFINDQKAVQIATYGRSKSHNERIAKGNFYLNRIQAVQALQNTTS